MHVTTMSRRRGLLLPAVAVLIGSLLSTANSIAAAPARNAVLAEQLQAALRSVHFERVLDTDPVTASGNPTLLRVDKDVSAPLNETATGVAQRIVQQPQVDATVLELNRFGRPIAAADVLMSPRYPHGVVVPLGKNLDSDAVRYREWDDNGWYANHGQGSVDIVAGRGHASLDFMSPYPASVLKTMATFGVLRLVDSGKVGLDDTYAYRPTPASSLCGPATTQTVRQYIDGAITKSSNGAGCALIKLLHDNSAIDGLNATFRDLGLPTLRLIDTNPANGGNWTNALTMTSLDTAKLLALINGAPADSWRAPTGRPVGHPLQASSRRFFLSELSQQGWNDQLTTSNWCGARYPERGIPSRVAQRWVSGDGTVTVEGKDFGRDVRPCNAHAAVTFAHKTGWVNNSANDAGIVTALPGHGGRRYIVSVFSNLGTQYVDAHRPKSAPGQPAVDFTQRLARLGRLIDNIESDR